MSALPPCPVCGGASAAALELAHRLLRCGSCGLLYSERIAQGQAGLSDYYRAGLDGFFDRPYFERAARLEDHPEYGNYRSALERASSRRGRLLDVGCGTGALMETAERLGFKPEGLEVSREIAGKNRFPIHIYDGDLGRPPRLGPFDVIVLWDVLEHLPGPVSALRGLKGLLAPGGVLLVRTINEDCLLAAWSLWLMRLGTTAAARRMHELHHVVYFTRKTLDLCLERAGFRVNDRWLGDFPAERVSRSAFVRAALRGAYLLQGLTGRTYEQYAAATPA